MTATLPNLSDIIPGPSCEGDDASVADVASTIQRMGPDTYAAYNHGGASGLFRSEGGLTLVVRKGHERPVVVSTNGMPVATIQEKLTQAGYIERQDLPLPRHLLAGMAAHTR